MNWVAAAATLKTVALCWVVIMLLAIIGNWILQSRGNKLKKAKKLNRAR